MVFFEREHRNTTIVGVSRHFDERLVALGHSYWFNPWLHAVETNCGQSRHFITDRKP
jgi:hypothetical protein